VSILTDILRQGGPVLWALLVLGIAVYSMLAAEWRGLVHLRHSLATWTPDEPPHADRRDTERAFACFELDQLAWVERRLPFLAVLIGAAPLLGLGGTVSGMLTTFSALSAASQAQPIDRISIGISEALVTTQAGLVIAIPASFLWALLRARTQAVSRELQRRLHARLAGFQPHHA